MAGQQFQYDDSGNTFFYFLTSFVGLIVIPATYYLWPRDQNAGESRRRSRSGALGAAAPLLAAPSCPQALPGVPVTPPARPGLRPRRPRGPSSPVISGAARPPARLRGPREFGSDPLRMVLEVPCLLPLCLPRLCPCWVFFPELAARAGEGRDGGWCGRRVGRRGNGAQLRDLRSRHPSSLSSRCRDCSCCDRGLGAPLSWVACLGLPSELTSRPPLSLPPVCFFHLFARVVGAGSAAVILFIRAQIGFSPLSFLFSVEFPVDHGKVQVGRIKLGSLIGGSCGAASHLLLVLEAFHIYHRVRTQPEIVSRNVRCILKVRLDSVFTKTYGMGYS